LKDTEVNVEADDWIFYLGREPDLLRGLLSTVLTA
jgi:hypothetical protein